MISYEAGSCLGWNSFGINSLPAFLSPRERVMGGVGVIWRWWKAAFKRKCQNALSHSPPLASQLLTTAWRTSPHNSNLLPWINHIMEPFITNIQTSFSIFFGISNFLFFYTAFIKFSLSRLLRLNEILN